MNDHMPKARESSPPIEITYEDLERTAVPPEEWEREAREAVLDEIVPMSEEEWNSIVERLGVDHEAPEDAPTRQLELLPITRARLPGLQGRTPLRVPPNTPLVVQADTKRCPRCGTRFQPDRRTQEYCSSACKQWAYRRRKR